MPGARKYTISDSVTMHNDGRIDREIRGIRSIPFIVVEVAVFYHLRCWGTATREKEIESKMFRKTSGPVKDEDTDERSARGNELERLFREDDKYNQKPKITDGRLGTCVSNLGAT